MAITPAWQSWLVANPDPRPVIARRLLAGTMRVDWTTYAETADWNERAREAGVPEQFRIAEPKS